MFRYVYLQKITYYVTGHLYDFTGICCVYLSRFKIDKTLAIRNYLSDFRKEASYLGLLMIRSINAYNHSSGVGFEHTCDVRARLFFGEGKRESASDQTALTVHSFDRFKDKKCKDPKLNKVAHDLSERSETSISKLEIKLSEDNQKELSDGIGFEISFDGVSPKLNSDKRLNEHFVSNMLICLNDKIRKKKLQDNILKYWNARDKKFVNLHELIFSYEILMIAYSEILKAKNDKITVKDSLFLNEINANRIYDLSKNLINGAWKPGNVRRIAVLQTNTTELRPFTVLWTLDKIVAIALKLVFTLIFEKRFNFDFLPQKSYFHDASHGFRSGRSCHTALNVVTTWGFVS